ncbi:hypothetical protein PVT68_14690 [Microbulbifer bruguierae]|uniref:Lipoprotein n=1 Tax=Microbulbifer bruguierae TaxID=3029061 RepID=A0ABY8NC37_9GAMM|nr:hypothetical protein [Microbulbifer bruguierae]WGL16010.1 hypothetical protein PVT68_14690 [Microbulbifer bruguierae]
MKRLVCGFFVVLTGCVVVPHPDKDYVAKCEISSDRKTLRVMNVAKETQTYYSLEGIIATPILYPATALVSGVYVAVNNMYNVGQEKLVCKS